MDHVSRTEYDTHFLFRVGHRVVTGGYVFINVSLFVSKQDYAETTSPIFTKFTGKAAHGPMKKRLDFVGNPDLHGSRNFLNEFCHCRIGNGK